MMVIPEDVAEITSEHLVQVHKKVDRSARLVEVSLLCLSVAVILLVGLVWYATIKDREAKERAECRDRYSAAITDAQANFFGSLGELVVISNAVNTDQLSRAALDQQYKRIASFSTDFKNAVEARNQYDRDGRPIPCQIG